MSYQREMQKSLSYLAIAAVTTFGVVAVNSFSAHNQISGQVVTEANFSQNQDKRNNNFSQNNVSSQSLEQVTTASITATSSSQDQSQNKIVNDINAAPQPVRRTSEVASVVTDVQQPLSQQQRLTARDIITLQQHLAQLGYYLGSVDGVMGSQTKAAISNFMIVNNIRDFEDVKPVLAFAVQEKQKLAIYQNQQPSILPPQQPTQTSANFQNAPVQNNSQIQTQTQTQGYDHISLATNSVSAENTDGELVLTSDIITNVQSVLQDFALDPGNVDGRIGRKTVEAIKQFQALRNLPQTGELSIELIETLERISQRHIM